MSVIKAFRAGIEKAAKENEVQPAEELALGCVGDDWKDDETSCLVELANFIGRRAAHDFIISATGAAGLHCDSPIERILAMGVIAECVASGTPCCYVEISVQPGAENSPPGWLYQNDYDYYRIVLIPQPTHGGKRLDFVLAQAQRSDDGTGTWHLDALAIECDGHDFHERTKEQASKDRKRDRELQAAGLRVFRFTGSDIWKDPVGCAREAIASLRSGAKMPHRGIAWECMARALGLSQAKRPGGRQ